MRYSSADRVIVIALEREKRGSARVREEKCGGVGDWKAGGGKRRGMGLADFGVGRR